MGHKPFFAWDFKIHAKRGEMQKGFTGFLLFFKALGF